MDNFITTIIYREIDTWHPYILTEVAKTIFEMMSESGIETMIEELNESLESYGKIYKLRIVKESFGANEGTSNE